MAHELDTRADGTAAMFSVEKTPWHRLGSVLTEAPSLSQALELAGLNFEVSLEDIFTESGTRVPDHYASVRTDRNEILGVVGGRYTPLQNTDAFAVLEPLLDTGLATLETGGSLRGGRDVWMMVKFNVATPAVQEFFTDEVVPYGLISNNHNGTRQVVVQETPIRTVCWNTLTMALRAGAKSQRAVGIRHTASVEARTVDAATTLWEGIIERYDAAALQYGVLKRHYLTVAEFRAHVLDVIAPIPEEKSARIESRILRAERKRQRVEDLWTGGKGHTGDLSAWEAYNAVVESVDHDRDIWTVRGEGDNPERRLEALTGEGPLQTVKDTALRSLLDLYTTV